jgi:chromosome segregation ATPase
MPFHDYAATESSTLIARLLGQQSDSSLQQLRAVRDALDAAARALEAIPRPDDDVRELVNRLTAAAQAEAQRAADEVRRVADEAHRHVEELNTALAAQLEENGRLASTVARADAEAALLKSELETAQERADAAERDLTATVEAHGELERILDATDTELRRATSARTQLETELSATRANFQRTSGEAEHLRQELQRTGDEGVQLRGLLERTTAEGRELREALDRSTAHTAHLQKEIQQHHADRTELDRQLTAAREGLAGRDALVRQLEAAGARINTLETELATASELTSTELEGALGRVRTLEAALVEAQAAVARNETIAAELNTSRARTLTLETQQAEHVEQARLLQIRLDDALQAEAKLRESVARAADVPKDEEQTETLRWELERMVSLFDASVRAVNEMARARNSGDLLAELVKRLSIQFSRVALFKVKGQGLEGEHHVGFEDTDIGKLVLPITVDSLLTRAITSGTVESLSGPDIASRLGTPFGGAPTSAVALPIVLQGTTLAVIYADDVDMPDFARGPGMHESSVGFAKLLVGEASVLLMCHTQELKTLNELRQYATTLLQEAKAMYLADAEAGKPSAQLRGRLKDNLECASQLYAYRAAMEGTAAAALLDEQIAAEMAGASQFSHDLADVVHAMAGSDLGITAEAS